MTPCFPTNIKVTNVTCFQFQRDMQVIEVGTQNTKLAMKENLAKATLKLYFIIEEKQVSSITSVAKNIGLISHY